MTNVTLVGCKGGVKSEVEAGDFPDEIFVLKETFDETCSALVNGHAVDLLIGP